MVQINVPEPEGATATLANKMKTLESGWSGERSKKLRRAMHTLRGLSPNFCH